MGIRVSPLYLSAATEVFEHITLVNFWAVSRLWAYRHSPSRTRQHEKVRVLIGRLCRDPSSLFSSFLEHEKAVVVAAPSRPGRH